MSKKIFPIVPSSSSIQHPYNPDFHYQAGQVFFDQRLRGLRDLRISVTDRCNFRCVYCMPKEVFDKHHQYLPHNDLLSFEEITRLASIFVKHGTRKIRLTGGEPLLRKNIEELIALLSPLKTLEGDPIEISLTTNGSLLAKKGIALKEAGLSRVTVSLDAIDDHVFQAINDVDYPVDAVLENIEYAHSIGLGPIKVNMVVKKGLNDEQIIPMAKYFKARGHILRFIEFMDVGNTNAWNQEHVFSAHEIIQRLSTEFELIPTTPNYESEVAKRWRYADDSNEIGIISSITQTFCHECTRARLSTEGKLFLCLFAEQGFDLRTLLRSGAPDTELANTIGHIWSLRQDNYSEQRHAQAKVSRKIEMSYIGG